MCLPPPKSLLPIVLAGLACSLATLVVGVSSAQAQDPDLRALRLFQRSAELYQEGRFAEAAELLEEAREIDPNPLLTYNLARALEGEGELEAAVRAYREYLELDPDAPDEAAVRARVENLERHIGEVRALEVEREELQVEREELLAQSNNEPEVVVVRVPESSQRDAGYTPGAVVWTTLGVGVVGLAAGGVLSAVAVVRHDDAIGASTHRETLSLAGEASDLALAANVAFAVGGVAVLTGAIALLIDYLSHDGARVDSALRGTVRF